MRLMRRALVIVVALVLLVLIATMARPEPAGPDPDTGGIVQIGPLQSVPVDGVVRDALGEPLAIWQGTEAPEPQFDTASLGPDLSWSQEGMAADDGYSDKGYVVYLGHSDGEPMLMWADERAARNPWDHLYRWFTGHTGRDHLTATFDCCYYSLSEDPGGARTLDVQIGSALPPNGTFTFQWLEVPVGTSIVAFSIDGEPLAYQRPVGRVASVTVDLERPFDVTLAAFGVDGTVLDQWTGTTTAKSP